MRALSGNCVVLIGLLFFGAGCLSSPEPHHFVDTNQTDEWRPTPSKAVASGDSLILTMHVPMILSGIKVNRYGDSYYLFPTYISTGAPRDTTITIDLSKFHPDADWPNHVYWWWGKVGYPIIAGGAPPEAKRKPFPRRKIEVTRP
jgi:hypothetical protein